MPSFGGAKLKVTVMAVPSCWTSICLGYQSTTTPLNIGKYSKTDHKNNHLIPVALLHMTVVYLGTLRKCQTSSLTFFALLKTVLLCTCCKTILHACYSKFTIALTIVLLKVVRRKVSCLESGQDAIPCTVNKTTDGGI